VEYVITFIGWQVFFGLTHCQQKPNLKLPTLDELRQMRKEAYCRFKQAIKAMAHHR
jgi:hypothetical protein